MWRWRQRCQGSLIDSSYFWSLWQQATNVDLVNYFLTNFKLESVSINILWGWFYCIVFKMSKIMMFYFLLMLKLAFEIKILKRRYEMTVLVFIFFWIRSFALDVLEFSSKLPGKSHSLLRKRWHLNDPWFKLLVFGQNGHLGRHVQ